MKICTDLKENSAQEQHYPQTSSFVLRFNLFTSAFKKHFYCKHFYSNFVVWSSLRDQLVISLRRLRLVCLSMIFLKAPVRSESLRRLRFLCLSGLLIFRIVSH